MHPNDTTLNDYADVSLAAFERAAVEQHLAGCAACRQTVEDLREMLGAAKEMELREPPVRAWSRLERAIKLEPEHATPGARGARPRAAAGPANAGHYTRYTWLAAAAAIVIATAAGLRYVPARPADAPIAAPQGATAAATGTGTGEAVQSIETELRQAETHYENAIKGLETIANAEQSDLDPRTAATLQKNLAVIDQAISESRAAVRAQPASEPAQ